MAKTPFSQSIARTGLKAGAAFGGSVAVGVLLALLLGGGLFFVYVGRLNGAGMTAAGTGGAGAMLALLTSPALLVAVLLIAFVPLYVMLGVAQGRRRALRHVVAAHGDSLSEHLSAALATRIEAMPRVHGALQGAGQTLSADALADQLAPALGTSRAVRRIIAFVVKRVPLSDLLRQWDAQCSSGTPAEPGKEDPALRAMLHQRVGDALRDMAMPSHTPLWIALGAHAVMFCVGLWLTR
ncbi:hypothetical protein BH11PSE13_BH11PSE13_31800 [soil metagenome]